MPIEEGAYLGGIRKLSDIRDRCWISEDGCWVWRGGTGNGKPSCAAMVNGKRITANPKRLAVILSGITIPEKHVIAVDPWCSHGQMCCNPRHTRLVPINTVRAAVTAESRLRFKKIGIKCRDTRLAKLSPEQVQEILSKRDQKRDELAKEYGVCRSTIYHILGGYTWKDVQGVPPNTVFSLGAVAQHLCQASGG